MYHEYFFSCSVWHVEKTLAWAELRIDEFRFSLCHYLCPQEKICDCRVTPVQRLGQCCTCEPGEYNPAQYRQDECPGQPCCCWSRCGILKQFCELNFFSINFVQISYYHVLSGFSFSLEIFWDYFKQMLCLLWDQYSYRFP